jgi:outer membrane protein TolC
MKRYLYRWFAGLQIGFIALSGCHPTQPFFLGERGDLAQYMDRAQNIEYPDLHKEPLPEVTQSLEPLSLDNQKFEYLDLTLEECISYALVNSQIVRALPGTQRQNADMASVILSSPGQQLGTILDPAIVATTTNSQPLTVDQNGNRILPRGSARANQVGGVEDALSEFDAQFSSFMSFNTTDRARNVGGRNVFNPQQFMARDTTGQLALSKRMATGGVVSARSQSIYSNNNIGIQAADPNNVGRVFPSDYTQILEMQVQHPLMRGRGTMVNRIPVVLARINEDIAVGAFEERVRNLVRDVEFAYWDLYGAYYNVETATTARDSAALAHKIAFAKFQKGQAANAEAQARVTLHQFQASLDAAIAGGGFGNDPGLYGREQVLRLLLGWAATDGRLIRPSDKPTLGLAQYDWESARAEMLTRNIDIRQQKWAVKHRELELISARNQALPDLNISLLYRWLGVGSSLIDRNGGNEPFPNGNASAFEELLGGRYQEGAVRLEFTPNAFGSRRALNDITNKQLDLARAHRVLEAKEEAAVSKLTDYWRQADGLHKQMTEQFQALNAAQRLVEVTQAKFDAGDANQDAAIDNLLRAQQSRATAGQNYIRAVAEYNKSLVDIHLIKGTLLEYNNIELEEGLWPDKAYWDAHERARERDAARQIDYGASRPSVISQGEYQQFTGSANSQARPASPNPGGPAPIKSLDSKPEAIPGLPEDSADELLEKRASRPITGNRSAGNATQQPGSSRAR